GQQFERVHSFGIADRLVDCSAGIVQKCVLWPNTWVVETCRYRMCVDSLAVFLLHEVGTCTVEHSDASQRNRCCVFSGLNASAAGFHTVKLDVFIVEEAVE